MKYFSMFSGIGGFEIGIQQAISNRTLGYGEQSAKTVDIQHPTHSTDSTGGLGNGRWQRAECVGYSEIDKYAIKVYERQFNGHPNYGDATNINAKELPDFDLLVGGFPCQAFSVAGKRKGFDDTRGTLFFDIARILSEKRPRHLVLENVKGLLSHDSGKTLQTILGVLSDLGYRVEWQVLNSKDFGVPQNRERIYIVGHLRGECSGKVFPITGATGKDIEVVGYLNSPTWQKRNESIRRVYSTDGVAPTLPTGTGGGVMPKIRAVLTPDRPVKRQNGRRIKEDGEPAFTVTAQDRHGVAIDMTRRAEESYRERKDNISGTVTATYYKGIGNAERPGVKEGTRIRRLTPLECERLQGFPDDWTKYGVGDEPISDTQRYKMCGNAVTANVVEAVMTELINHNQLNKKG